MECSITLMMLKSPSPRKESTVQGFLKNQPILSLLGIKCRNILPYCFRETLELLQDKLHVLPSIPCSVKRADRGSHVKNWKGKLLILALPEQLD
ncbi:hypothetical protein AOLI_G00330210 [Acnodon oligacanthus]